MSIEEYCLELPLFFEDDLTAIFTNKEPQLNDNAKTVLQARYLKKNINNEIVETYSEMFQRVASTVAIAENSFGGKAAVSKYSGLFYDMMVNLDFMPNSPTLMNAGRDEGQLSACFVLPVGDSMPEIFDSVKMAALIQKSGGGVGYSFSRLRPQGDRVKTTNGVSSGPISFMKVFNEATETVKQGGRRRGANMGVLRVDHPDIISFIDSKLEEGQFSNFNISVAITDKFMEALKNGTDYELINPRKGNVEGTLSAQMVWDKIIYNAWKNAEPGILYLDRINQDNPTPELGMIESTNPCGEACLLPYEACNLGSINLSRFVHNKAVDYARLRDVVRLSVRFLDDVIDVNEYVPLIPRIKQQTRSNRKIGLGIMGFADMLISLGISYNDAKALKIADNVMAFIREEGRKASMDLAKEKGCFPNWEKSVFYPDTPIRNATITSIAPTGTISIISGCSPGIEPLFGVCFERNVLDKAKLLEIHPLFEKMAKEEGFFSEELMHNISGAGTIQDMEDIPENTRRLFVTSHDVPGDIHVKMQSAFQKHVDMSVSKTINLSADATIEDVAHTYELAYQLGAKGLTVYRYGSREGQVIVLGDSTKGKNTESPENDDPAESLVDETQDDSVFHLRTVIEDDGEDNGKSKEKMEMDFISVKMELTPEENERLEMLSKSLSKNGSNGYNGSNGKNHSAITEIPVMIPSMFSNEVPCPECGEGTIFVGACSVCQHCGYSKCG